MEQVAYRLCKLQFWVTNYHRFPAPSEVWMRVEDSVSAVVVRHRPTMQLYDSIPRDLNDV